MICHMTGMDNRPTIPDLAAAAGVSVSTVNRILAGSARVRRDTVLAVQDAARRIGFYGIGAITARAQEGLPHYRFGFLLQQSTREIYRVIGQQIAAAARAQLEVAINPVIEFMEDLQPEAIADRLLAIGKSCDALALVAPDHPVIAQAIRAIREQGKPVVTFITDQSSPDRAGHVGTDNWKLGRTAAWFIARTARNPGRVAVFIGNHRYQCQDISDAGFRSYIREHAPGFTVEESRSTHEDPAIAEAMVAELLANGDDLVGIFMTGGGVSGTLEALRRLPVHHPNIQLICRDISPATRRGLAEGLITAALCHPLEQASAALVAILLDAVRREGAGTIVYRVVPFDTVTPESA